MRYYIAGILGLVLIGLIPTCFPRHSNADVVLGIGAGKNILGLPGTSFERVVNAGYQSNFDNDMFVRAEVGYFFDLGGNGQKSSPWATLMLGAKAKSASGMTLSIGVGPTYLHEIDTILGSHFEFNLEGCAGIDGKQWIGMCYKHLSNAGTNPINRGRDFLMVQWSPK